MASRPPPSLIDRWSAVLPDVPFTAESEVVERRESTTPLGPRPLPFAGESAAGRLAHGRVPPGPARPGSIEPDPSGAERAQHDVYRRLRAIAGHRMQSEDRDHTLQATAVVHEVWLRLMELSPDRMRDPVANRSWILAMGASLTRHVLVDHARRRLAIKRGGGRSAIRLTATHGAHAGGLDVLLLDDLLHTLSAAKPLEAQVVALRVFGGMTNEEIAHATGETDYRIRTAWAIARAWIGRRLVEQGDERQVEEHAPGPDGR